MHDPDALRRPGELLPGHAYDLYDRLGRLAYHLLVLDGDPAGQVRFVARTFNGRATLGPTTTWARSLGDGWPTIVEVPVAEYLARILEAE